MANIFRMLQRQHAQILGLLEQLEAGSMDEVGRRQMVDQLVGLSSRHEATEEMVFWPAVRRRLDAGPRLSEEGLGQEGKAKFVLDAMRFETSEAALSAQIAEILSATRSHIDFEERQVWPQLRAATGPIGRALLGRQLALAERVAPTRPHPRGPDRPGGLATAGMAASMGDKLRDALGGRDVPRADGPVEGVDAADFLMAEHARIDNLLGRIEREGGAGPELAGRVVKELSVHDSIEREHLYPVLRRRLPNGNEMYGHWLAEHGQVAAVLAEIDRRPASDHHRQRMLLELVSLVRTHVAEEEGTILPSMRARMSDEERRALGQTLEAGKAKAPTRPHSHIAGAGLGARMSRIVVAPVDKTRDAISGRT